MPIVQADASDVAMGAILLQRDDFVPMHLPLSEIH